jgi:hypothetical protein
MPALADLDPHDLAVLVRATDGRLPGVVCQMVDEGLDPIVFVVEAPPHFAVLVLALHGDEVIAREVMLRIAWRDIDEATRLGVLLLWVQELHAAQERWWRRINRRQRALGLPEVP